jgi:hypothetical protein
MIRSKTVRRGRKAASPIIAATDISGVIQEPQPLVLQPTPQPVPVETQFDKNIQNFFVAESAAMSIQKPWLRLERGIRLQKFRTYANAYPGLTTEEQENLYKVLMKANDAKLLNTKQQITYENGVLTAVRGLKVVKSGDPTKPAVFKIDIPRPTKKNIEEPSKLTATL